MKHTGQDRTTIGGFPPIYLAGCLRKPANDMPAAAEATLERDTFKSAEEAREFGLIDDVIEKRPVPPPNNTS